MAKKNRKIGDKAFVDGSVRPVYEDANGRQFVIGDEGEKVRGEWLVPPDEPATTGDTLESD
jgi:hypothetical protein